MIDAQSEQPLEGSGTIGPLDYRLPGPQVEPAASLWLDNKSFIRVPPLEAITFHSESGGAPDPRFALDFSTDFPVDPANPDDTKLRTQLEILIASAGHRTLPAEGRQLQHDAAQSLSSIETCAVRRNLRHGRTSAR
jgi:hypothetical protein